MLPLAGSRPSRQTRQRHLDRLARHASYIPSHQERLDWPSCRFPKRLARLRGEDLDLCAKNNGGEQGKGGEKELTATSDLPSAAVEARPQIAAGSCLSATTAFSERYELRVRSLLSLSCFTRSWPARSGSRLSCSRYSRKIRVCQPSAGPRAVSEPACWGGRRGRRCGDLGRSSSGRSPLQCRIPFFELLQLGRLVLQ